MVKTPNVRHSKSHKDPVTIDLEASRLPSEAADAPNPDVVPPDAAAEAADTSQSRQPAAAAKAPSESGTVLEGDGFVMSSSGDAVDQAKAEHDPASNEALGQRLETDASSPEPPGSEHRAAASPASGKGATRDQADGRSNAEAVRPATRAPEPKRGGLSAIAAGIIGGIITLAGAGALQYGGLLPAPSGGGDPVTLAALQTQIAGLQTELSTLKSGDGAQAVADLRTRIEALAQDVASLRSAVETGGGGDNAGLAALDAKISGLEAQLAQLGQAAGGSQVDLAPLNDKVAALEAGIKAATDAAAAGDGRLTTLEQSVAALTAKLDAQGNQPKIALSIASSALKAAIDRGQPFSAELETLAAISPNLPQLPALRAHAESGVATRDDLLAGIDAAANAMIAADKPVDPNADYLDQLLESAASLVTVRPVGAVAGEGVPETVARMEAALKAGDLAQAITEYDTLPATAKAAGEAFAAKVKARVDVETLVDQAIAEAMKTV